MLDIKKTVENGAACFAISGRLDTSTAPRLEQEVKAVIADVLAEAGEKRTVTELIADSRLNCYTNQKISALKQKN